MSLTGKKKGRLITKIQFEEIIKKFLVFLRKELRTDHNPPIVFVDDLEFARKVEAFGNISSKNEIHISIINRHPMDILRTIAHEYAHYKQHIEKGSLHSSPHAGSPTENQANAKAGELVRKYGNRHPELFDLMPIR